jgi:hypothetical protein
VRIVTIHPCLALPPAGRGKEGLRGVARPVGVPAGPGSVAERMRPEDAVRSGQRQQGSRRGVHARVMISRCRFQNFVLPNQNPRLRYFTMRRPVIVPVARESLEQKIEWIATKLFNEIVTQYGR